METPLDVLTIDDLRRRTSLKWNAYPDDVIPMWVAEMDVPICPAVRDALVAAVELGDTGYPIGDGYSQALAAFAADRWGWTFDVEHTAIVPDVMLGIVEVLRLLTDDGDAVVVTPPVYGPFFQFVESMGRRLVHAPLGQDGRVDLDRLDSAFGEVTAGGRRAAFLLCNPHNPTGVAHTEAELTAVAALAFQHGVRVVADEIHGPLVLPGADFTSFVTVAGGEDGITLMSASKAWNLAGLKAALAIAGPAAADDLARIPEEVSHGPSHLGIIAHTAALRDGQEWLDGVIAGVDRNHRLLERLVTEQLPGVRYHRPDATYLAWLDFRETGLGDDPAAELAATAKVALSDGLFFGPGGQGHARMNLATSVDIIIEAVARIAKALDRRSRESIP